MARRKTADSNVSVGNIRDVSGEVTIAGGDIYKGFTADQVSVLVKQITSTFQPKPFDGRCPYKGLEVFDEEDAELFFGRERLVDDLVERVKESRTVFITGPSGSGKSSLVQAGLIPALKQGAIKNSDRWLYETIKPGRDPLEALALAFSRLKSPELADYFRQHIDATDILYKCAESVLSGRKDQRLVFFIDQFEEVFTQLNKEEERVTFLNLLTNVAAVENGRVIILFAMRSDFVSNCATYPQLNALLNQQFVQIGAMQPDELVSAIAQPALRLGLRIDPDLIAQIINDMQGEPGALPLMQFALKDLFDSQQSKGGVIALTLNDYYKRGGIHKALERHADDSFNKLDVNEQQLARSIFTGLIEIGRGTQDTRRTVIIDELVPAGNRADEIETIIRRLADARLITTDEIAGKDTVTISHEKLIDAWPWLKKLVNENRDVIALQNELAEDAKEWEEHQHDNSYLYGGARLATAREKIKSLALSEKAINFLNVSITIENHVRLQSERMRRRIFTGLIGFSLVVLGLLIFALIQLNISRAQRLGSLAQTAFAQQNYNTALLYAYQSNLTHNNNVAESVLGKLAYENFAGGKELRHTEDDLAQPLFDVVSSVTWSADGQQLASGSWDGTVVIWDPKTSQRIRTLKGHTQPVESVAWSPNGLLASSSRDGTVIIWDPKTGQKTQPSLMATGWVRSVAWSADGLLASGSDDGTVIIWDIKTGKPAHIFNKHNGPVYRVAWSSDGKQLASGSGDGTVIIWDIESGEPAHTLNRHTAPVFGLAWSVDGQLASGSEDGKVILWDLTAEQPILILQEHTKAVYSVAWSPNGELASGSGDNTIILWNITKGQPAQIINGNTQWVLSVAWSPNGQLASGSADGTVIFWDLKSDLSAQTLIGHSNTVNCIAWSVDGQLASGSEDGKIIIWDLKTGEPTQPPLKGHKGPVYSVAWSPDGQLLASGSEDGTVIIWNIKSGEPIQHPLTGHKGPIYSVAWSPDGQLLASGSAEGTIIVWDLKTYNPALPPLTKHTGWVRSVAWSPNGQKLASGADDGVIIWDLKSRQLIRRLNGYPLQVNTPITSVAWSLNGEQLASGSGDSGLGIPDATIIIWDIKTGRPIQVIEENTYSISSVVWSVNGLLASGATDGTVAVWDPNAGRPTQIIQETDGDWVTSVAWSKDGQLAFGSVDKTIRIARGDLIGRDLCSKILRNMTVQEWLNYQGSLYVYQPACPNLPSPTFDPIQDIKTGNYSRALITWEGRCILLGFGLVCFLLVVAVLRGGYRAISWLRYLRAQAR